MAPLKTVPTILADFQMEADTFRRSREDRLEADPVLAQINDRSRELGMEKLQATIDGQSTELFDQRLWQLEARRTARIQALGLQPYRCNVCQDTGLAGDGYCQCLKTRIYMQHFGAYDPAQWPVSLNTYDFGIFDRVPKVKSEQKSAQGELVHIAYNICKSLISNSSEHAQGLFLHGEPGLGKTRLIGALARSAAEQGIDTVFIHAVPMFDAYHKERLGYPMQMHYLETAQILILDDLGAEPMTTNVTTESLLRLLTYRMEHGLPSVIATNQSDIRIRYGERIASRIGDTTEFANLELEGVDLRDQDHWNSTDETPKKREKKGPVQK